MWVVTTRDWFKYEDNFEMFEALEITKTIDWDSKLIPRLTHLKELEYSTNKKEVLPKECYRLDLKNLSLRTCDIDSNISLLQGLTRLSLENVVLLPPEVGQLTNLKKLSVRASRLEVLPKLGSLINLKELDLSSNRLTSLPILDRLVKLNMFSNMVTELPRDITRLTNLKVLNLACNKVSSIRPEIKHLNLTVLDLEDNCLKRVPFLPASLGRLMLARNRVETIDVMPGQLDRLHR